MDRAGESRERRGGVTNSEATAEQPTQSRSDVDDLLARVKERGFVSNPNPPVWRDRRLSYKTYILFRHLFLKTEILGLWGVRRDEGPPPVALVKLRELPWL